MPMTPRLILFARYPTPGKCKTRLIPALGPDGAAALHKHLTERTMATLRQADGEILLASTGAKNADFAEWLGTDIAIEAQVEGDLTARLSHFLDQAPLIFFGSDTPDLSVDLVNQAVQALKTNDLVIGPAEDGGYYLIGMKRGFPQLFENISWSTDQVLLQTLAKAKKLGITPKILNTLSDCDLPDDLKRWPDLLP